MIKNTVQTKIRRDKWIMFCLVLIFLISDFGRVYLVYQWNGEVAEWNGEVSGEEYKDGELSDGDVFLIHARKHARQGGIKSHLLFIDLTYFHVLHYPTIELPPPEDTQLAACA